MSQPIKLAIVSDAVMPWNQGGKEARYSGYISRLASHEVDATVYTMKWWKGEDPVIDGVRHEAIAKKLEMYTAKGHRSIKQSLIFSLATLKLFSVKGLQAIEADQIPYLQLFPLWLICKVKGIPLITTWHEYWGFEYWREYLPGVKGVIGGLVEAIAVQLPTHIVAVSDESYERLSKSLGSNKKITKIMSGLPLADMNSIPRPEIPDSIVYVGRLIDHKRVDLLIDAYRRIVSRPKFSHLRLQIIGSGPQGEYLATLAKDLPNCEFLGDVPEHSDVWKAIKSAQVLVLPSEREGFGLVVAEALALGVPIVTSDHEHNAARHLAKKQPAAYIFKAGNSKSLAKQIVSSLISDFSRDEAAEIFLRSNPSFDWNVMAKQYSQLIKELVRL